MALFGMGGQKRLTRAFLLAAAFGSMAQSQQFEVASIKPNQTGDRGSHSRTDQGRYMATNIQMKRLLLQAFNVRDYQIEGPEWLDSERFDISAKFPENLPKGKEEFAAAFQSMLQKMLADRFQLTVHHGQKILPVYGLTIEKKGVKFQEVPQGRMDSNTDNNHYEGKAVTMAKFAEVLSGRMDRPVIDMTGLTGFYDLKLNWFPEPRDPGETPAGPALPEALQEQLGLKFEPRKAPIDILVIDHLERTPTEN